ncbi:MAG: YdcF family protein [Flavobacteriia bacterium]|nr:YdcF family protein [Flavobacteriia bacterium]
MFFILSKIIYFFINPFTWIFFSGLLFFILKRPLLKKICKIIFISSLVLFSNTFIFLEFERLWEIHSKPIKKVSNYDVGIVLTGMFEYDNELDVLSCRRGTDRIWQAITLYKLGKIKKIFISGGSGYVFDRGLIESQQTKDVLLKWGFPEKDIIIEKISRNTYENAVETKKVLSRSYPHLKKFLLITSGQHMRRSRAIFKKQGIECDTYSTDLYTSAKRFYFWDQYFVPNVQTISDWNGLIKEWVGYVIYDIVGYI